MTETSPPFLESLPPSPVASAGAPRIWPALSALVAALPLALTLQALVLVAALLIRFPLDGDPELMESRATSIAAEPSGMLLIFLTAQLAFLGLALAGAKLSPKPLAARLGLRRPDLSLGQSLLVVLGTLFVTYFGATLSVLLFGGLTENMRAMGESMAAPSGGMAFLFILAFSIAPGVCEELLCRGFVQRRLLRRWSPLFAIGVSSLGFAALHLEPQHILSTIPVAIWLGLIAWRTDSTVLGMACHGVNNAVWLSYAQFAEAPAAGDTWSIAASGPGLAFLGVTAAAFLLSARLFWRKPLPTPSGAPL